MRLRGWLASNVWAAKRKSGRWRMGGPTGNWLMECIND